MMFPKPDKRKKGKNNRFGSGILSKAWKECARHIKLLHTDAYGNCQCVTCGKRMQWLGKNENVHAGHYFNWGKHSGSRFYIANIWIQCKTCNYYPENHKGKFGIFIAKKLSKSDLDLLEWHAYHGKFDNSNENLENIYKEFKVKNDILLKSKMF